MSQNRNNNPGPIPNRWLHCPRKSDSLIGNKFLAFKTPLSSKFDPQVPDECTFYPSMLFQLMKDSYKVKIGLWIDLTNTNRFYDRSEVEKNQCQYVKLKCRGFGETPSQEQTKSFIEIVDNFTSEHPFEIIAIHCTHGFNRTGFLISSYLVEREDCSVEAALQMFAQARPPGIYKDEYIKELFARYEDVEDAPPAPELPEWCFNEEETPDEYSSTSGSYNLPSTHPYQQQNNSQNSGNSSEQNHTRSTNDQESEDAVEPPRKKKKTEFLNLNATFMAGVNGVTLLTDKVRSFI